MPARSRHRPSLHSGSPTRAPPPPLEASLSGEARRAPDSGSGSDADPETGPGTPIRNKEVSGSWGGGEGSSGWARAARVSGGVGDGGGWGCHGQNSQGPWETVEGAWRVPFRTESEGNGGC